MGFSDFVDTLGITSAAADGAETFVWCKYFGYLLKVVAVIFEIACGGVTLHRSRYDLEAYKVEPNITVQVDNQVFNSTVQVDAFEKSFHWFCGFYALDIVVSTVMVAYQIYRNVKDKEPKKKQILFWIPVALCVELPLIICESVMLKSRGIIDFHDQMYDMILHIIFVLNLPFQTVFSLWMILGRSWKAFCIGVFLSPFCFLLGCMEIG